MIRPATGPDLPVVQAIIEAAYAPWVALIGRRPAPMDADHAGQIQGGQVWLHGTEGVLVLRDDLGGLLLDNVAVRPEAQGRGIGKALIRFAETEARRRGHSRLWLYTNEKMTANIALYERLGFRETRRHVTDAFSRVDMERALA